MLSRRARRVSARGSLDVPPEFQLPRAPDLIRTLTRLDRWARFGFPESEVRVPALVANIR